nr:hypothetical protein [uncultured Pedobacter sp.]
MNVNNVINQFVSFINNSYEGVDKLSRIIENNIRNIVLADKVENGFYQFIWEIIVETQLCCNEEYLEPYGDGADFYGKSSRVIYPEKLANRKIGVSVKDKVDFFSNKNIRIQNLDLIKFVNYNGSEYSAGKPFDFVLCEDSLGNQFLFRLNEVDYLVIKVKDSY